MDKNIGIIKDFRSCYFAFKRKGVRVQMKSKYYLRKEKYDE